MSDLILNDEYVNTLEVSGTFDSDGEVSVNVDNKRNETTCYLSREQVKQLRDHLDKLLAEEVSGE